MHVIKAVFWRCIPYQTIRLIAASSSTLRSFRIVSSEQSTVIIRASSNFRKSVLLATALRYWSGSNRGKRIRALNTDQTKKVRQKGLVFTKKRKRTKRPIKVVLTGKNWPKSIKNPKHEAIKTTIVGIRNSFLHPSFFRGILSIFYQLDILYLELVCISSIHYHLLIIRFFITSKVFLLL